MSMRRRLAALLALCLLLALAPAAMTEDLEVETITDDLQALEIEAMDDGEPIGEVGEALEVPQEGEAGQETTSAPDVGEVDGNALEAPIQSNATDSLVRITKPANGETVNTGTVEVWCRFVNPTPSSFSSDDSWKYLGVNYELLKSGVRIDLGVLTSYSVLVFVDDGIKVGSISITSPGDYTLRASVPGSPDAWDRVDFKVIGATITPEPTPEPTPKPTPEPVVTVDDDGFGVDQRGILRSYEGGREDITIPNGVNAIGENAFKGQSIKSVTLHGGVTKILDFAFGETGALSTVTFADGLKTIGEGAFFQSGLKKLVLPDTVTTIGTGAFHQCGSLTSVTVPASVSSMGGYMFSLSEMLKTVTFEKGSKLKTFMTDMFYGDTALENVILPDSLETLGEFAFTNCTSLKSLTLPDSLTTILDSAFENCTGLTELVIPAGVKTMELDTFKGCANLTLVVTEGSYAEQYAKDVGIAYRAVAVATPTPAPTPAPKVKLSKGTITVKQQVYTGKALKPAVTVKVGKKTLKKGTDYTVSYKNNVKIGTATVTVKGKGGYTGSKSKTFRIVPKAAAWSSLKAGKKRFTAKWKKQSNITGYQVQYALKKDFTGAKSVRVAKAGTLSVTVKSLKSGKKYYVRIRTYKTVSGKNYYSGWSKVKSATTK